METYSHLNQKSFENARNEVKGLMDNAFVEMEMQTRN